MIQTRSQLIVALDVPALEDAEALVRTLAPLGVLFKVGYEPLYAYGDAVLRLLQRERADYFLDVKLHDIPRTVAAGVRALVRPGLRIINVHALGGAAMMEAAVEAARARAGEIGIAPPQVFAVTMLTSIDAPAMGALGIHGTVEDEVVRLATLAQQSGCSGVVTGVAEVPALKARLGSGFLSLCPGIRPGGSGVGDQKRVATPADAASAGADYVVVGRPIVEAEDPVAAARAILDELDAS
jgi:orotidine-5'-phosphate decarboxylase